MTSTHPVDADDLRPDPDALLARVQQQEAQARRGRLKIFFGASAGVGKTYAMLSAAHAARAQGSSLVVGLVDTHGRAETEALLAGLPLLALKEVPYRDRVLQWPQLARRSDALLPRVLDFEFFQTLPRDLC